MVSMSTTEAAERRVTAYACSLGQVDRTGNLLERTCSDGWLAELNSTTMPILVNLDRVSPPASAPP
jgi:hypothetical protein